MINWLVTLWVKPRILPKLLFKDEIPAKYQTLVVIPALIANRDDVDKLVHQIEMHFLRNPEPGLNFALLTDFPDADSETLPEDEGLVSYAISAIGELNAKYERSIPNPSSTKGNNPSQNNQPENQPQNNQWQAPSLEGQPLFYFLHRKRLWNQSEGKWMGWERKRGKLQELNHLLRGGKGLSFLTIPGSSKGLEGLMRTRFVITLDTDTILPRGAATRLIGTLAHPLNHRQIR